MALINIFGVPRSGKTYYIVHYLLKHYFDYKDGKITPKEGYEDVKVVTNIDSLKIPHESLDQWIKEVGSVEKLFSKAYQEKVHNKYPKIVYIFDEAHDYFPSNFNNADVISWFAYHGHWGQDIFLITQLIEMIPLKLYKMAESHLEFIPSSLSVTGGRELKYNSFTRRVKTNEIPIVLLKKKELFELYKSHDTKSTGKLINPLTKKIILLAIMIVGIGYFIATFSLTGNTEDKQPESTTDQKTERQHIPVLSQANKKVEVSYITQSNQIVLILGNTSFAVDTFPFKLQVTPLKQFYTLLTEQEYNIYFPENKVSGNARERSQTTGQNYER